MILLVTGGRTFDNHELFYRAVMAWVERFGWPSLVVHGGAPGADSMAGEWAGENRVPCRVFPADWATHGRRAGPLRNAEMVDFTAAQGGAVLALPGGTGTSGCVKLALAAGLSVLDWR